MERSRNDPWSERDAQTLTKFGNASCVAIASRLQNKHVMFVTNNGTKSRKQLAQKLQSLDISANEEDVMCSAYVAANYLSKLPIDGPIYVIGEGGIFDEFANVGIHTYGKVCMALMHFSDPCRKMALLLMLLRWKLRRLLIQMYPLLSWHMTACSIISSLYV